MVVSAELATDCGDGDGVEIAPGIAVPPDVLRFTFVRSGGPGGQHVNKVATKARLRVAVVDLAEQLGPAVTQRLRRLAGDRITTEGELIIAADESRSQRANRQACLDRLRALIVEAQKRPRPRRKTRPSAAARQRRIDEKKRRSATKERRKRPDGGD